MHYGIINSMFLYKIYMCENCHQKRYLKFYTNGVSVWNRNGDVMPNGVNLDGHQSSSQSAIKIPKPGSTTIFYIFTTDAGAYENPPNNGIHYSIVDMTKEKSMGDVVKKNIELIVFYIHHLY